jgi:hypothetical protein
VLLLCNVFFRVSSPQCLAASSYIIEALTLLSSIAEEWRKESKEKSAQHQTVLMVFITVVITFLSAIIFWHVEHEQQGWYVPFHCIHHSHFHFPYHAVRAERIAVEYTYSNSLHVLRTALLR